MSNHVVVFHKEDKDSNEVRAIDPCEGASGEFSVWVGSKDEKLHHSVLANSSFSEERSRMLDDGYVLLDGFSIDLEKHTLVKPDVDEDAIPEQLWCRISSSVGTTEIQQFLHSLADNLKKVNPEAALMLTSLSLFKVLFAGKRNASIEYQEGPLGLLLLYSLRRRLECISADQNIDTVEIVDDNEKTLPCKFDDIDSYIRDMYCIWATKNAVRDGPVFNPALDALFDSTQEQLLQAESFVKAINSVAIAMFCIDAPLDLTLLKTETKSSFF